MSSAEMASASARNEFVLRAVLVGPAAGDVRRAVGPVAWCCFEYLAASPYLGHGDGDTVVASVRSLAFGLGVSKNTAHRALSVLRSVGFEPVQSRRCSGRFDAGRYRLTVSPAVVARADVGAGECVPAAALSRALPEPGRGRALRSRSRGRVEQLSLLPGG